MLYSKIDENNMLTRKVERLSAQTQQLVLELQLANLQHQNQQNNSSQSPLLGATASTISNSQFGTHG